LYQISYSAANKTLHVESQHTKAMFGIKLMNIQGSTVQEMTITSPMGQQQVTIDCVTIPEGLYIVALHTASGVVTKRIIVN
ncbi:MAG TPA: T9SS type A sorting domain-containing protein, partial [Cytophagales bacterium]|nr:T9SS type A sorting domain-containing protein [Cytophagales bacterium]